ncbi:WYL domain-containing protein [Kitasatospora sp. NPDC058478]|uniref:WYL domain-containing protein n=1 Tax=unclassified Kitasatospora TaxID=2633591 RepID=UPI003651C68B
MIRATDTATTTTRLIKAMDRQHPVTVSYVKEDNTTTVRTIEIYDFTVSKAGNVLVKAMDRTTGERRDLRIDRITGYTVHRTRYLIEREDTTPTAPTLRFPGDPMTLVTNPDIPAADLADPVTLLADLLSH